MAELIQYEVGVASVDTYSFNDLCSQMKKPTLLMEPESLHSVDCTGASVSATDFCSQKEARSKAPLLRGMVSRESKKVICERGMSAVLKLSCDTRDSHYCGSSENGCQYLRNYYAKGLNLVHHSLTEETGRPKTLSCYFSLGKNDTTELKK